MTNDITTELAKLHQLSGAEFSRQVERIACRPEFHPLEDETEIFTVGGEQSEDYSNLLNAARKAVSHGYRVYILPNPKGIRSADFIFERKGLFRMYDLKTIQGQASVSNRLAESIGQSNQILINLATSYDARRLAKDLISYFKLNQNAIEVLIFKRGKLLQVTRKSVFGRDFVKSFMNQYFR